MNSNWEGQRGFASRNRLPLGNTSDITQSGFPFPTSPSFKDIPPQAHVLLRDNTILSVRMSSYEVTYAPLERVRGSSAASAAVKPAWTLAAGGPMDGVAKVPWMARRMDAAARQGRRACAISVRHTMWRVPMVINYE